MLNINSWPYVFFTAFAVHLFAISFNYESLAQVTKPMLLPALLVCYLVETKHQRSRFSLPVVAALFFSWVGDVLLMFQDRQQLFFILGLASFLLAHVFYIIWFVQQLKKDPAQPRWLYIVAVALYACVLMYFLWPHLGEMKLPVFAYAIIISLMLALALHVVTIKFKFPVQRMFLLYGAKLFVISDSLLAINKFHTAFAGAGFLIMLTYGLAQYFLVKGILLRQQQNSVAK